MAWAEGCASLWRIGQLFLCIFDKGQYKPFVTVISYYVNTAALSHGWQSPLETDKGFTALCREVVSTTP